MMELNNPRDRIKIMLALLPRERCLVPTATVGKKAKAAEAARDAGVGKFATPEPPRLVLLKRDED